MSVGDDEVGGFPGCFLATRMASGSLHAAQLEDSADGRTGASHLPATHTDMSSRSLQGLVAFITGGGRGIGASIARRLSSEGARIAVTYRRSHDATAALVRELSAAGAEAIAIQADNASPADIRAAVDATADKFGRLDILVNNAAVSHAAPIEEYAIEHLDEMLAVNVRGAFVATQEAVRHMTQGGRIINIGSISSDFMPYAGHAAYAMTKGALASLTRGLARDLGARGITVNNVQPGRIDTELVRAALGTNFDEARLTIPVGRFGAVDDVANLVAFLAGPQASFINGANLRIDGGVSL